MLIIRDVNMWHPLIARASYCFIAKFTHAGLNLELAFWFCGRVASADLWFAVRGRKIDMATIPRLN